MQGVYTVLTLVGLGLLILLYGAVRNSATRYIWAVANHEDRPVRREIRRRLRGRRMAQLGTALCNLLLCVPFLWLAALQLKDTFLELCQQLVLAMSWNGRPQISPDVVKTLLPLTLTFFLTYMPLLPARRILTAAFAVREPRHTAPRNGQPVEEDPTLPKAIVRTGCGRKMRKTALPTEARTRKPCGWIVIWPRAGNEPAAKQRGCCVPARSGSTASRSGTAAFI